MFNKIFITNLIALVISVAGYFSPKYGELILTIGLFALSGGITNWLAIHMLFEKIPLLYGSGIVQNRFEEFKISIKKLVVNEFFTYENIDKFIVQHRNALVIDINNKIDFDRVFDGLVDAIERSQLGHMIGIIGGRKALQPLKEPITIELKEIILELAATKPEVNKNEGLTSTLLNQVEQIIDQRLKELTPQQVKGIIQKMIHEHLGWLVVWGGVFGGLIGCCVSAL